MRTYTPFAKIEPMFVLADPRMRALPPLGIELYLVLWCRAVAERREILSEGYGVAEAAQDSKLDVRTCAKMLRQLQQKCLITIDRKKRITVCGVRSKHERIEFKDGALMSPDLPRSGARSCLSRAEKRRIKKPNKNSIKAGLKKQGKAGKTGTEKAGRTGQIPGVALIVKKFVEKKAVPRTAGYDALRLRQDLIVKASERLSPDALGVVAKVCDDRMPCSVLNRCIEMLCRNAVQFAGAIYDAGRGDKPGALMTSFVTHGMKSASDDALRWAQRVVVREAKVG